ncbi:MAG: LemA family protein [Eubacterium sp.]|nr:LemA family protein [Eubacterium sp.]
MKLAIGIVVVVVILLVWYVSTFNSIKRADLKVSEALSGIDVALTKRYDVLTKMLDVTKAYKIHEKEVLTELVSLRAGMSMSDRNAANSKMDALSSQFRFLAENYPELRSSENFVQLQRVIADVEEHLQASRRLYNANVTAYNGRIVTFPSNIVAGMMGATSKAFFEADEVKRQDVKMNF